MTDTPLSRTAASNAVEHLGWRYLLGTLHTSVAVTSLQQAVDTARIAVEACGNDADAHLITDLRPDRVELALTTRALGATTQRDVELAQAITTAIEELELATGGATTREQVRSVQVLELAIDTVDPDAIRPFWRAVLGYVEALDGSLLDPAGQQAAIWFQEMDPPRLDRNRIHVDITVPHDEADGRVAAALAAGGRLLTDVAARSFWVLADADGNEVCVCTWQDRDEREAAG